MKFLVTSEAECEKVFQAITTFQVMNGDTEVIIRKPVLDRSLEQNKLYWLWMSVIGNELGNTKEEQADIYKGLFLIKIYVDTEREQGKPGKYTELAKAMSTINGKVSDTEYQFIRKQVIAQISTTDASVKQMREYLNQIKAHAGMLNIALPLPEHKGLI